MKHIIVKFVPRLPFRSGLMLGDLSRHGYTYPYVVNWHRGLIIRHRWHRRDSQFDAVQSALVNIFDNLRSKRTTSAMILKNTLKHLDRLNFDYGAQNDAHHFVVECACQLLTLVNERQIISITRVRCEWCVEVPNTVTETHIISTTERNAFVSSNICHFIMYGYV